MKYVSRQTSFLSFKGKIHTQALLLTIAREITSSSTCNGLSLVRKDLYIGT